MAATAAAVVTEEDTELRDLLVQTLENSGVLNRIKAELRAAVFLALEEQEKVENKAPLVNESLRKFLNTRDGRLVASLVAEFLQFFNLDFTLAVFKPETSTLQGLEGREKLARDLGIIEAEGTVGGPLLLEVIRRCQHKEKGPASGEGAFALSDGHSPPKSPEGKNTLSKKVGGEASQSDSSASSCESRSRAGLLLRPPDAPVAALLTGRGADRAGSRAEDDDGEGDSFFDNPVPKPEKTFGWRSEPSKHTGSLASLSDAPPLKSGLSSSTGSPSLKDPERTGDEDYADDFNSTSHRSEKSELSIGEEIEEDLSVEIDDLNTSDKLDDLTQDLTASQLSDVADYLEDVA